jgi:hypothetical protein
MLFLGPCTRNSSMVSMNCATTKRPFRIAVSSLTKWPHRFIYSHLLTAPDFQGGHIQRNQNVKTFFFEIR